ncbi:gas vesicle protein K [Desulfosporosinus sp. BICA1-9]|uniref:gas vesicle protein K n=1 Tax=Desulfosporosinus sp. BICA1-9 TaxID=1531958 RepID=UPI00054B42EB|nr:gas vesicle protein K [Desulfosporosinus sp. BICA1-9]KJS47923.1 MAG: gas vesicle protein GvpK [Peptococcaceae bacterium BRH_c23]KJS90306.1 MAG: gas vesicle protein GvpK [Desulfosporosinus sp. BICA1-9]HBW38543.1 gas vesicle protein K [Desulfosporosinus sp.]
MIEDDESGIKVAERIIDFEGQSKVGRVNANQDNADQGLAKLVLSLVELLRRVMEHEALRRIDGGTLTEGEIEEMGETFLKLENKMIEMREIFGLKEEDLNLDLGPLGKLM